MQHAAHGDQRLGLRDRVLHVLRDAAQHIACRPGPGPQFADIYARAETAICIAFRTSASTAIAT